MSFFSGKHVTLNKNAFTEDVFDQLVNKVDSVYSLINIDNWREITFEDLELDKIVLKYLRNYLLEYERLLNVQWAKNIRKFIILHFNNEYEEYYKIYNSKLMGRPDNYYVEYSLGEYFYKARGKVLLAREHYKKADALLPENAKCKMHLSFIYNALGDSQKNLTYCRKALENADNEEISVIQIKSQCLFNMGVVLINQYNDIQQGKEMIKKAIKIRPDYEYAKQILKIL